MEINALMDFAAEAGKTLLESGAETSRVEDTLSRIIKHFYNGHTEIFVVLTGFFVNIGPYTKTVRVKHRTINLDKIAKINMLSRDIVGGKVSFEDASARLEKIQELRPYPMLLKTASTAVCCCFFTLLFGGKEQDGLNSLIVGAVLHIFTENMRRFDSADFIVTFCGGAVIASLTILMYAAGIGSDINAIITGSIMPLVPGLAVTNALRDIIAGDYISGGARLFDATVTAAALAAGAGIVMHFIGGLVN